MRTLTTSIFVILLSFLIPMEEAQAKRLGGGFSLGKSYTAPKKVSPTPTYTKQQDAQSPTSPTQTTATAPRRSGFGGLMGGLLAGGLLGALFFGGAFEGIQLMDILIFGLIGFVLFKLFAGRRQSQQPAYAGMGSSNQQQNTQWRAQSEQPQPPIYDGGIGSALAEPELKLPEWFNKKAFLDQACNHFSSLQKAWDESNWDEIRSYTSPELFEELKAQRARFPERQHTEVVSVMADLINFIDEQSQVIVSLHFYGWLREDEQGGTAEFSEIWHLSRDMTVESADWFIVGIEQPK
ncbi:TIM44-like domain-containing protein [Marinobacterium sp. D7]|uniref:Tim44 domain-containing protein n=1 Tax=Marinobacterium ramblicola TaxID=2849041 RepID=UPI001C2D6A07|nr:TIM44-like domain-containing protein [Marinobacterium ramblicola]MBV1789072.1 TIM44-like domain-containing protein [Marinobacterium ramblicola]